MSDVRTPAGRATLLAVCEAYTWLSCSPVKFAATARTALPQAIEYIERLEAQQAADAAQFARGAVLMGQAERRIKRLEQALRDAKTEGAREVADWLEQIPEYGFLDLAERVRRGEYRRPDPVRSSLAAAQAEADGERLQRRTAKARSRKTFGKDGGQ